MNFRLSLLFSLIFAMGVCAQKPQKCAVVINPIELSYRFQAPDEFPSRREAADPVAEFYKGYCYLFASKSSGYWRSKDLAQWEYIPAPSIDIINDYAPTIMVWGDEMYFTASSDGNPTRIFKTATPWDGNSWTEIRCELASLHQHDPAFFKDDDGRVYFYWGCSNVNPIMGVEVDPHHGFRMKGTPKELIFHHPSKYGWEQFGADNETDENGWNEGPAMLKVGDKYYLQYASNGTEFRMYCSGCYVSDSPLGPFTYVEDSPFCIKPGGFMGAAGHGHTFMDPHGNYWHVASMLVGQRHRYERRLGLFPVTVDSLELHAMTALTTYPWHIPSGKFDDAESLLEKVRLLSTGKQATASSSLEMHGPEMGTDNKVETWWSAATGNVGEWFALDLGATETVNYIHVNFADEAFEVVEPYDKVVYQYKLEGSKDGRHWFMLADRRNNTVDAPHTLITLEKPIELRYIRITNEATVNGKFSLMDLRVFGKDRRPALSPVTGFTSTRNPNDGRMFTFTWDPVPNADGYILRWGMDRQHLTHAVTVEGNTYHGRYFNRDTKYEFAIEAY